MIRVAHVGTFAAGLAGAVLIWGGDARAVENDAAKLPAAAEHTIEFSQDVLPILRESCVKCHGAVRHKGELRLDSRAAAIKGGEEGEVIKIGDSAGSALIARVAGVDEEKVMPPKGARLTAQQVGVLRAWIDQGARWPEGVVIASAESKSDLWSIKPIAKPTVPVVQDKGWGRNPIDAFVVAKLREKGLGPSAEADRRTLIRRVSFDLTGLPPAPEEVEAFASDSDERAYEKLVDRLLASPRYGERWARHWLDVAHYGETHGYDKDKTRPNAWPYRDYVIRAFNEDKPYERFVHEQIAGDVSSPGSVDGITALGFLAAGPWDYVGHVELREGTIDKAITRNIDRDDMVSVTMNAFVSLTAQCARCHDHKFDPITQEDYYSLQAVFAAVDRADRPYETDALVARQRLELQARLAECVAKKEALEEAAMRAAGKETAVIDARLAELAKAPAGERPEFGYHSQIEARQDAAKWVQVDLGKSTAVDRVVLVGCHDDFNHIGAGFGFPVRFKLEISDDSAFGHGAEVIADRTGADVANPGVTPQEFAAMGKSGRYVRVTATKLAPRSNDYIFALAELMAVTGAGDNVALGKAVLARDSIEAPPRWQQTNLVDGYYYGLGAKGGAPGEVAALKQKRRDVMLGALDEASRAALRAAESESAAVAAKIKALPAAQMVFAAATEFAPSGSFAPTKGKARRICVLRRGSEKAPGKEVGPGTVACVAELASRFDVADEAQRRAALARWIVDRRNPLTWRSIVNRVWQYHFGRGIVETPNDFGHMGAMPTHPELLDWLAAEFRDGGQSMKQLHRLIVTSSTYRQSSLNNPGAARVDASNQYLWRMDRRRLDAEAIRDAMLYSAGKLDLTMGGPGFQAFGFKDDHSPHYEYREFDPDDPKGWRRSIYRFVVRSVPDPFMDALDCADPSQSVPRRNETLTALQALALLNDRFVVRMAEHLAERASRMAEDVPERVEAAYRLALGRRPTEFERETLVRVAREHGMANACRVIFNANEFVFVD